MFDRILVPTDFSPPSEAALECAKAIARRFGGSVHLFHVLEELSSGVVGSEIVVMERSTARHGRIMDTKHRLMHRLTPSEREELRATYEVVFGTPAETIVNFAADNGFDLIVMGTHGRTGLAHMFVGSVAERVVRTAHCPVLTTHTPRARAEAPVFDEKALGTTA